MITSEALNKSQRISPKTGISNNKRPWKKKRTLYTGINILLKHKYKSLSSKSNINIQMLTEQTVKQTHNNYKSTCRKYNLNYLA